MAASHFIVLSNSPPPFISSRQPRAQLLNLDQQFRLVGKDRQGHLVQLERAGKLTGFARLLRGEE
jgi:hypothetical protein